MTHKYEMGEKLYVIVRNDLSPGMQIAQAIHAKDKFSMEHPAINNAWYEQSNYICVLQVADEDALFTIKNRALSLQIRCVSFSEPDRNDELTAIAIEPGSITKELCKNLKLALH